MRLSFTSRLVCAGVATFMSKNDTFFFCFRALFSQATLIISSFSCHISLSLINFFMAFFWFAMFIFVILMSCARISYAFCVNFADVFIILTHFWLFFRFVLTSQLKTFNNKFLLPNLFTAAIFFAFFAPVRWIFFKSFLFCTMRNSVDLFLFLIRTIISLIFLIFFNLLICNSLLEAWAKIFKTLLAVFATSAYVFVLIDWWAMRYSILFHLWLICFNTFFKFATHSFFSRDSCSHIFIILTNTL